MEFISTKKLLLIDWKHLVEWPSFLCGWNACVVFRHWRKEWSLKIVMSCIVLRLADTRTLFTIRAQFFATLFECRTKVRASNVVYLTSQLSRAELRSVVVAPAKPLLRQDCLLTKEALGIPAVFGLNIHRNQCKSPVHERIATVHVGTLSKNVAFC